MKIYDNQGIDDLTANANRIKECLIEMLASEGLLNGDPYEIAGQYVVVIHEPSMFGKLWMKFVGKEKPDGLIITVLKAKRF